MVQIVSKKISRQKLKEIAANMYGEMMKTVVDIELNIMAIDGELHSDEEAFLLEQGSKQGNLWGINIYPEKPQEEWIEFDSIINLRPSAGNRSRYVEDPQIRARIQQIVDSLVK